MTQTQVTQVTLSGAERHVEPYDFQRRDALERARLRLLQPTLDALAHRVTGSLTSIMQTAVKVEIGELEQQRWDEYVGSLPEQTFLVAAPVAPMGGRIVLHLPLPLSMNIVEMRLGGPGSTDTPERPLTEFEQRLVTPVADGILAELPRAFPAAQVVTLGTTALVSNAMFLPGSTPSQMCLLVGLRIELGECVSQAASMCVPLVVLLPILDAIDRRDKGELADGTGLTPTRLRERLLSTDVLVRVHWPEVWLTPDDLLSLVPGDVVPLNRARDLPIVLSVGGAPFCEAFPTTQGKFVACRVVGS